MEPLKRHVLGSAVIFTDDTTPALKAARGDARGKTITARLWVYIAGGWLPDPEQRWRRVAPAALYDFTTARSGAHQRRIPGAWRGFLQADDYSGYAASFRSGVVHAACLVHARRRFAKIDTFVEHGILEADNNISERAMKPVALSRKNWLFAGSERGGQAAAVAFSLIETARLNGVEPYAYLRDVLQRINGHRRDRLEELLPMNWRPA